MNAPDYSDKIKMQESLFELIKTNFRKLQRYLRIERPEQYAMKRASMKNAERDY